MAEKLLAPSMDIIDVFRQHLALPDTQRDYTWEKKHVETFFEDLMDEEALNYIGLIILWGAEGPKTEENPYLIYDGQQRITSFYVLLIAIRQRLQYSEEENGVKNFNFVQESRAVQEAIFSVNKMIMSSSRNSFASSPVIKELIEFMIDFEKWDGKFPIKDNNEKGKSIQKFKSETRIVKPIYIAFKRQIEGMLLDELTKLIERIESSQAIVFYLNDVGHANNVFRRVNSTGKALDIADLIKNEIIGPTKKGKDRDNILEHWSNLSTNSFNNTEQVIRYEYMIKNGHIGKKGLLSKLKHIVGTTSNERDEFILNLTIFSDYYENINNHFDINKTKEFLKIFDLLQPKKTSNEDYLYEIYNYLFGINRYNVSQCQTVIYAYIKKLEELKLKDEDGKEVFNHYLRDFLRKIEALHFGANYICGLPTNKVEKPYADFSKLFTAIKVNLDDTISGESSKTIVKDKDGNKVGKKITLRRDVNEFHKIENELFETLLGYYPSESIFQESFLELNYMKIVASGQNKGEYKKNTSDTQKISYILSREAMIDKSSTKYKMRSSAEIQTLLVKEKDRHSEEPFLQSAWSLDHWFPQNPIDPDTGKNMDKDKQKKMIDERFDDEIERTISTPYIHNIGNLIYATAKGNTDFKNKLPPKKIEMILDSKNPSNNHPHIKCFVDQYKNEHENWNATSVETRAKALSKYCYDTVWAFKPKETFRETIILETIIEPKK